MIHPSVGRPKVNRFVVSTSVDGEMTAPPVVVFTISDDSMSFSGDSPSAGETKTVLKV